jgi:hypothetical protein
MGPGTEATGVKSYVKPKLIRSALNIPVLAELASIRIGIVPVPSKELRFEGKGNPNTCGKIPGIADTMSPVRNQVKLMGLVLSLGAHVEVDSAVVTGGGLKLRYGYTEFRVPREGLNCFRVPDSKARSVFAVIATVPPVMLANTLSRNRASALPVAGANVIAAATTSALSFDFIVNPSMRNRRARHEHLFHGTTPSIAVSWTT